MTSPQRIVDCQFIKSSLRPLRFLRPGLDPALGGAGSGAWRFLFFSLSSAYCQPLTATSSQASSLKPQEYRAPGERHIPAAGLYSGAMTIAAPIYPVHRQYNGGIRRFRPKTHLSAASPTRTFLKASRFGTVLSSWPPAYIPAL